MIVLICAAIGAAFGSWRARKRNGNRLDVLQYAAVHALIFALFGLFATIIIERNL